MMPASPVYCVPVTLQARGGMATGELGILCAAHTRSSLSAFHHRIVSYFAAPSPLLRYPLSSYFTLLYPWGTELVWVWSGLVWPGRPNEVQATPARDMSPLPTGRPSGPVPFRLLLGGGCLVWTRCLAGVRWYADTLVGRYGWTRDRIYRRGSPLGFGNDLTYSHHPLGQSRRQDFASSPLLSLQKPCPWWLTLLFIHSLLLFCFLAFSSLFFVQSLLCIRSQGLDPLI